MNKDWDKAVVSTDTWKECLRVLKPGAFAFIMSSPRQDVLSRMIVNLQNAGFRMDFTSIYWTYASGFPKAANISKLVDKRNGKDYNPEFRNYLNTQRLEKGLTFKDINQYLGYSDKGGNFASDLLGDKLNNRYLFPSKQNYNKLKVLLDLDNRFDELIEREEAEREIIGKGQCGDPAAWYAGNKSSKLEYDITKSATEAAKRLDGSYAGFQPKPAVEVVLVVMKPLSQKSFVDQALDNGKGCTWLDSCRLDGRFPANLLVSDDALNGHSKYFDLDKWYSQIEAQFIICPKASVAERNKGLKQENGHKVNDGRKTAIDNPFQRGETIRQNTHATVKPIKLMSYLITMGSRPNDLILDPFVGSGTTAIAAITLGRRYIGIEKNKEYVDIATQRLKAHQTGQTNLLNF